MATRRAPAAAVRPGSQRHRHILHNLRIRHRRRRRRRIRLRIRRSRNRVRRRSWSKSCGESRCARARGGPHRLAAAEGAPSGRIRAVADGALYYNIILLHTTILYYKIPLYYL